MTLKKNLKKTGQKNSAENGIFNFFLTAKRP